MCEHDAQVCVHGCGCAYGGKCVGVCASVEVHVHKVKHVHVRIVWNAHGKCVRPKL